MGKYIAVEIERCMGCKSCEIACAVEHSSSKDIQSIVKDGEKPGSRVNVEAYGLKAVPVNCNHCDEPACLVACPTGAIYREQDGGPVLFDNERCIGCKMCVQACPFGVITVRSDGRGVLKCDLCIERLADGREPACVTACPTKALRFIEEKESNKMKRLKAAAQMVMAAQAAGEEMNKSEI